MDAPDHRRQRCRLRSVGYWPGDGSNPPRRVLYIVDTRNVRAQRLYRKHGSRNASAKKAWSISKSPGAARLTSTKNLIILGNNNGERTDGPAGRTKVYDARTGKELWRFKGHGSTRRPKNFPGAWLNEFVESKNAAGLNVWGWYFSIDEQR